MASVLSLRNAPARMGALLLAASSAALLLWRFDPQQSMLFPPCLFHALTGYYCPGCGSTRALYWLVHLQPGRAFAMNPVATLAVPVLLLAAVSTAAGVRVTWRLPRPAIDALWILLVLFAVMRNLPWYPFNLLAPGGMLAMR